MAGTSTPQLAAAVSNAGGLGSLGIGANSTDHARQAIQETRRLTDRPFNVNVFCHEPAPYDAAHNIEWIRYLDPLFLEVGAAVPTQLEEIYQSFLHSEDTFDMLLQERPAVVSFHFGIPSATCVNELRQAGIKTMATATNQHEATLIEQCGIEAIVAQGIEAGGHRGMFDPFADDEALSTSVLVRLLSQRTRLPIIAAGGIMDGKGVKAALDLGAVAAQLGTAFILCPESAASASYRKNLKSKRAHSTMLTSVISGRPARGMVNRLIQYGEAALAPAPAAYPYAYDAAKQLNTAAAQQNNHEFAAQWAGQGAPLARELSATELMATLIHELEATL